MENKTFNPWKWAFIILVFLLALLGVRAYFYLDDLSEPIQTGQVSTQEVQPGEERHIQFRVSYDEAESFVNSYLDYQEMEDLELSVDLGEDFVIEGRVRFLSFGLPFRLTVRPEVLDNGNLIAHIEDVVFLEISLPITQLMNLVNDLGDWPDWVFMDSEEEIIGFNFNDINWPQDGYRINIERMAPETQEIVVNFYIEQAFIEEELFEGGTADAP